MPYRPRGRPPMARLQRTTLVTAFASLLAFGAAAGAPGAGVSPAGSRQAGSGLPPGLASAAATVSIESLGRPLPEVLERLSTQTERALTAGAGLEDQKLAVLFHELPSPQALQAVAA